MTLEEFGTIGELQGRLVDMVRSHQEEIEQKESEINTLLNDCKELARLVNIKQMKINVLASGARSSPAS